MTEIEVRIDSRVHSRIIGTRGRAVRKLMDDYKVDIRFPRANQDDPDIVTIMGQEDNVYDCKDHLLNLEEEYVSCILSQSIKNLFSLEGLVLRYFEMLTISADLSKTWQIF